MVVDDCDVEINKYLEPSIIDRLLGRLGKINPQWIYYRKLMLRKELIREKSRLWQKDCPVNQGKCFKTCSHYSEGKIIEPSKWWLNEYSEGRIKKPSCKLWTIK